METISVKILPITETKPQRLKAYDCDGNSVTISYPNISFGDSMYDAYRAAAEKLCQKMGWNYRYLECHTIKPGLMVCSFSCLFDDKEKAKELAQKLANEDGKPYYVCKEPDERLFLVSCYIEKISPN